MKTINLQQKKHAAIENLLDTFDSIDSKLGFTVDYHDMNVVREKLEEVSNELQNNATSILKELNILKDGKIRL